MAEVVVELHCHDEWSLLDGVATAQQGAERAAELGMPALAKTNHAALSGCVHHMKACQEFDITPIVAVEAYYRPNRLDHTKETNWEYFHMVLLAKDARGWRSLKLLTSEAYRTGWYRKPCIDDDLLDRYHDSLIISTACISGFVPRAILRGDHEAANAHMDKLDRWVGDDWYFELQPHDFDDLRAVNLELPRLAIARSRPLVVTKDAHVPWPEWVETQHVSVYMRTRQTMAGKAAKNEDDGSYDLAAPATCYMGDADDTRRLFAEYHPLVPSGVVDEGLRNTLEIASRVAPFQLDGSPKLPRFKSGQDALGDDEQLARDTQQGLLDRGHAADERYTTQAAHELKIFSDRKVSSFFLITADFCDFARDPSRPLPELSGGSTPDNDPFFKHTAAGGGRTQPIPLAARGSASASTVCYALRITNANPIAYDFRFERFLNPNRAGLPDIDLDGPDWGMALIKEYVKRTYGADKVYDMIAHGTLGPRSALRRVSVVYDVPFAEQTAVTKQIPEDDAKDNTPLEDLRRVILDLDRYADRYPDVWRHAVRLQGQVGTISEHPAGVVISSVPLDELMPVMKKVKGDDYMVTAFGEEATTEIVTKVFGLMKVDLLVIVEMAKHAYAEEMIRRYHDRDVRLGELPPYEDPHDCDPRVMEMFRKLPIVFQFTGSPGMRNFVKKVGPKDILQLTAMNAIYRPGPIQVMDEYIARTHDPSRIDYWDPSVVPILKETLGLMIYQEQVMDILVQLGGFSAARADDVRRIMSKYYRAKGDLAERMLGSHREDFVSNASGICGSKMADKIWSFVGAFCEYSFNKPHAGQYSLTAYGDAWVGTHYPDIYFASLLTFPPSKIKKPEHRKPFYERVVRAARLLGVEVLPPDINDSDLSWTITRDGIRLGLGSINGLGPASIYDLLAGRPYETMEQLVDHTSRKGAKANAGARKALGGAGALDRFGVRDHMTDDERMQSEEERVGIALSAPDKVGPIREPLARLVHTAAEVEEAPHGAVLCVGGELIGGEEKNTRKGLSLKFDLAFGADEYRCSVAPWNYDSAVKALIDRDEPLIVRGTKDQAFGCVQVDKIELAADVLALTGLAVAA